MQRILNIHQPHFLPWPGYIARCVASTDVVFLDNVKFNKGYYHNRTKFIRRWGEPEWLTVPVDHSTWSGAINQVAYRVDNFAVWGRRFRESYARSEEFGEVWAAMQRAFREADRNLAELNVRLLKYVIDKACFVAGAPAPIIHRSSRFPPADDKSKRLLTLCESLGATGLIMGDDSYEVHDVNVLREGGVKPLMHVIKTASANDGYRPVESVTFLHEVLTEGWQPASNRLFTNWELMRR